MISFYAISPFLKRLDGLLKVKRGMYAGVDKEILNAFEGISMDTILNNRDMILLDDPIVVIKLRLPDKKHHLAKKDGYRLIYMAFKHKEMVVLLDIYPKNGPLQQLDLSDNDLISLIDCFNKEMQSGELAAYNQW